MGKLRTNIYKSYLGGGLFRLLMMTIPLSIAMASKVSAQSAPRVNLGPGYSTSSSTSTTIPQAAKPCGIAPYADCTGTSNSLPFNSTDSSVPAASTIPAAVNPAPATTAVKPTTPQSSALSSSGGSDPWSGGGDSGDPWSGSGDSGDSSSGWGNGGATTPAGNAGAQQTTPATPPAPVASATQPPNPTAPDPNTSKVDQCKAAEDPANLTKDCQAACVAQGSTAIPDPASPCVTTCTSTLTDCIDAVSLAATACLTNLSPWIQKGAAYVEGALAGVSLTGVVNQCSTMANVMNDIQLVLGAYNIACGGLQARADLTCPNSKKGGVAKAGGPNYSLTKTAPLCNNAIQGYILNLATGAGGILESLLAGNTDNSCAATTSTGSTAANSTTYNCSLAVNKNSVVCLCQATPTLPECAALAQNGCVCQNSGSTSATGPVCTCSGTISTAGLANATGTTTPTAATTTSPATTYSGVTGDPNFAAGTGTDSSGTGYTSTGSPVGSSGLGGSSAPTTLDTKKAAATTTADKSEDSFYGGGGGSGAGSGARDPYAAYRPGGAQDPTKRSPAQAAYQEARDQIRTAASADNFSAISICISTTCPTAINTFGGTFKP